MKFPFIFLLLVAATSLIAQSPVRETLAYSRNTVGGIPGSADVTRPSKNPFPTAYFIYVVVKKETLISGRGVCLLGKWHTATLKKVDSPVLIDQDVAAPTGKQLTLVKRTADDVYQVQIAGQEDTDCKQHIDEKVAQTYEVVVCLKSDQSSWRGLVRKVAHLQPAVAM